MYNMSFETWAAIVATVGVLFGGGGLVFMQVAKAAWYKRLTPPQKIRLGLVVTLISSIGIIVLLLLRGQ